MNRDFVEMLSELSAAGAEFLVVGAHALAAHGVPRATGDLDVWVRPTLQNAERVLTALKKFGAPLSDLRAEDLTQADTVFQIGLPPARIDLLSGITGVRFDDAWARRVTVPVAGLSVSVLSREDFVANKRASGRPKDLADLALLDEHG
ncbi:MAG: nucleotidyltransferase [Acidobacteria bacterium]|nr:nucleotidyltransferase [Acidobacteriota bacterium]